MATEATDGGRPVETGTDDVLDAFEARADPAEPLTATDVADRVDCSRRTALNRLNDLADVGKVASKKVGGRARVWWVPLDAGMRRGAKAVEGASVPWPGAESRTADESDEAGAAGDESEATAEADASPSERVEHDEPADVLDEALRSYLEATDQPPKTAHGRNAVLDVFRALRERGEAKTGQLQDVVYPGYEEHWSTARTMWNGIDRYLPDIPGIKKGGYGEWEYTGDESVREALADYE